MIEQLKHWSAMAKLTDYKESVLSADELDEIAAYIGALQQKLDAMVAENAAMKESVDHAAGCVHAAEVEGLQDALESHDGERLVALVHRRLCHAYLPVETPATDAYMNSVRAEGVDSFIEKSPYELPHRLKAALSSYAMILRSGTHDTADKAG